jgi:hypothetical protein
VGWENTRVCGALNQHLYMCSSVTEVRSYIQGRSRRRAFDSELVSSREVNSAHIDLIN